MKPNSLKYCCQITFIHKVKALIFPFYRGEASGIGRPHPPADHRPQYPLHPPWPAGDQGGGGYEVLQRPDELCPPGELQHPPDDALYAGTGSYTLLYIYSYPQNYMCAIIICEIGDQHKFWRIIACEAVVFMLIWIERIPMWRNCCGLVYNQPFMKLNLKSAYWDYIVHLSK